MLTEWNVAGVIPPIFPGAGGADSRRSPYPISILDFVERFNSNDRRREILDGFIRYRQALSAIGIVEGVQWVDGSFLEDVESLEGRLPNDVDVVTFFLMPDGRTQQELMGDAPQLFDHDYVKQNFKVDSYLLPLGRPLDVNQLRRVTYWYSMWSHRRDGLWKGFAELSLTDQTEPQASEAVQAPNAEGEQQ